MPKRWINGPSVSVLDELTLSDRSDTFLSYTFRGISVAMRCAYVGIASRNGLESLHAEEPHTARFLLRRAARQREKNAVCFWSVMSPEAAAEIQDELACDRRAEAFLLLQSLAYELGRILPDSVDPVAAHLE
jgi:hypothetical protein